MLEHNGHQILTIIGKLDSPVEHQGILLPAEMPAAIVALEAAVAEDEIRRTQLARQAQEKGEMPPTLGGISLRLRAIPFVEMLRRCHTAEKEIVWGV